MDHTVEIWSVSERTLLARHTGHRREISAIAFFPDGRRIVSSSGLVRMQSPEAGDVHLWDPATGQLCLDFPTERHEICSGLAISPDGRRVFGATNDTRVVETDPLMMLNPQGELLPPKLPPRPIAGRILCWEAPELTP